MSPQFNKINNNNNTCNCVIMTSTSQYKDAEMWLFFTMPLLEKET